MNDYGMYAMMLSSFLSLFMMISMFLVVPFYIFLYLVSDNPKKILSGIFSIKFWGIAVMFFVIAAAGLLNIGLGTLGLREGLINVNQADLRGFIIMAILGGFIFFMLKRHYLKSVIKVKDKEKKAVTAYVSHIFHIVLLSALFMFSMIVVGYTLNYLLQFGLREQREQFYFMKFIVDLISMMAPLVLLWLICRPALMGKRFLPKTKTEGSAIFIIGSVLLLLATALVHVGQFINMTLVSFINNREILGYSANLNEWRAVVVGIIISFVLLMVFVDKSGGLKSFKKA